MVNLLIVGVGGFIGAVARYALSGAVQRWHGGVFPLGTMSVNVIGCLVIGAAMTIIEDRPMLGANTRLFFMIGLLGSFTTFSTFGYETVELLRDGEWRWALWSTAGNVLIGTAAVVIGRLAAKAVGL